MLVAIILLAPLSGLLFYVFALKSALPPRRWAMLGCLFGPAVLPLFMARRRWSLVCARGMKYALLRA
ncbi:MULTISPECIES: hypothetical protein [Oceanimonas]|uniref:Uncharacterized protein n=1 Tax=Oceanimonas doudoroffii TaxID=84158 RepID=A0A233RHA0_9GAMM|nr:MULTISPECIES: hypothetical protein [Oceanimonas]NHI00638.1 hypothetical protein [Oceanimonas sp. MB9]OXY82768.1 hypothetical protein B6S08_04445 [Oceanimonas doudoroffii]